MHSWYEQRAALRFSLILFQPSCWYDGHLIGRFKPQKPMCTPLPGLPEVARGSKRCPPLGVKRAYLSRVAGHTPLNTPPYNTQQHTQQRTHAKVVYATHAKVVNTMYTTTRTALTTRRCIGCPATFFHAPGYPTRYRAILCRFAFWPQTTPLYFPRPPPQKPSRIYQKIDGDLLCLSSAPPRSPSTAIPAYYLLPQICLSVPVQTTHQGQKAWPIGNRLV